VQSAEGFGKQPLLLLTDLLSLRVSPSLWWIVPIYLTRWKTEETFRFVKQSYHVEDIRVLRYQRLKNSILLVTAAAYFAATFLGQNLKLQILCERLLIISQRFFGIPPFPAQPWLSRSNGSGTSRFLTLWQGRLPGYARGCQFWTGARDHQLLR
jgi:hypothetical protein